MYLLYRAAGHAGQVSLWHWRTAGRLTFLDLTSGEVDRMAALMTKYEDLPMDLADASLIMMAERLGSKRILSLDSDFYVYRLFDGTALEVVP
jgi:predicted nucleic acid-binding protein